MIDSPSRPETSAAEAAATAIVVRLQQAGHAAYFAGGCVRDRLLGRVPHDYDVATDAVPDRVQELFPRTTGLVGKSFGVVGVIGEGNQTVETVEVATFRQDIDYQDGRRPAQVRFVTAEQDAQRRDFTVNGLFFDPVAGKVIDYVGGQADLKKEVLRAIGDPAARFAEDKLRLLRAVRFAVTLGFEIEGGTWKALCGAAPEIVAGQTKVSPERIRDELDKIWVSPDPARGLDLLDASGLLRPILPELADLHGVEQPPQFHPEGDVYKHTRLMLSHLKEAPLVLALSVLFHDIGKPATFKVDATGRIRFNTHETVGARMTEVLMERLRYSNDTIKQVVACVENHMTFKDVPHMRLSTLKRLMGRPTFSQELELHRIDCSSSHGQLDIYEMLQEKVATLPPEEINPPALLSGRDLMAAFDLREGRRLGEMIKYIREGQLEGKIKTREEALAFARRLLENL